jgi:hypothetical protein
MLEKNIKFSSPLRGFIPEPKPSLTHVPQAYKKHKLFIDTESKPTVKRCIPFLDALTMGYIIPHPVDIEYFYDKENKQAFFNIHGLLPERYIKSLYGVDEHTSNQMDPELRNPKRTVDSVFKFLNPWTITTPPGYSCLFVTPSNHVLPFDLITGVVDTDQYPLGVNFPFYWTADPYTRRVIKAGDPMVMVIPFKREKWKMTTQTLKETEEHPPKSFIKWFQNIGDNYKRRFWSKKSYK